MKLDLSVTQILNGINDEERTELDVVNEEEIGSGGQATVYICSIDGLPGLYANKFRDV